MSGPAGSYDRVLLIGMMGSGKSSVGPEISVRTGWPYRDNDQMLAELAGVDTAALLERDGVDALRAVESTVLHHAVEDVGPLVAGVAGGVVERSDDLNLLRGSAALVVYLHASLDALVERVGDGAGRPFLQPDPRAALGRFLTVREPLYREVADLVVDTERGEPSQHAAVVLAALRTPH